MAAKIALFWNDTHTNFFSYFLRKSHFFFYIFKNIYAQKKLGDDKNSWNSAKTALFSAYEFFISEKIKWKSVLATKKAVFQGTNTETAVQKFLGGDDKNSWNYAKTALSPLFGLYVIHIPHLCFLSKCPAGKKLRGNFHKNQTQKTNFWRKLLRKSHKNQTQKTKFWREMLRKSYFLKKKKF